ncbi:MAG: helix-turn-helix transcriptional regulator [Cyclobacteriaceae bacterium]
MSIFNHNLRFLCEKTGLSQQKLADLLDVKRGKVAGYFYETQAKPDFHQKLINHFHIDLGKFLTLEMDDMNYESFFSPEIESTLVSEPSGNYQKKIDAISLLLKIKHEPDPEIRSRLLDEVIGAYGQLISENMELKDKLMESLNRFK